MATITLGSTGITVERNGFGALPIQRISKDDAAAMLRRGYEGGMRFFDTARAYSDSEEKIGYAFGDMGIRDKIYIASKTHAKTPAEFWEHLETSLRLLKTDYLDIYQFHQATQCYKPGDGTGMYECMQEAKAQGKIRHIGLTAHLLPVAQECITSGLYETLQFPLSYISGQQELQLVADCKKANMGFIGMKALAGGLITNSAAAYAFMSQFDHVVPIWGVQRPHELEEFLSYVNDPPTMTAELEAVIEDDRQELVGEFCRGCGYCMPCPMGIEINQCARMSLMMRRAPFAGYMGEHWQKEMAKIETCLHCGKCSARCPYQLDTPALLARNYEDYKQILAGKVSVCP